MGKGYDSGKGGVSRMNILILSAGTRDKVVQYFKKEVGAEGRVVATDCSNLAPAVYDADRFYLVPRITAPDYLDVVLDICKKEQITGVFSLIDPELSLLAKERRSSLRWGRRPLYRIMIWWRHALTSTGCISFCRSCRFLPAGVIWTRRRSTAPWRRGDVLSGLRKACEGQRQSAY